MTLSGNYIFQPSLLCSTQTSGNLQCLLNMQDSAMLAPKGGRNRRKSSQGSEHIKHRRTRSGCYTCRSRRVKCDETQPICERCRKGGRDCVYPDPATLTKSTSRSGTKSVHADSHDSPDSSTEDEDYEEELERLNEIPDEEEITTVNKSTGKSSKPRLQRTGSNQPSKSQKSGQRFASEGPSSIQDKDLSPTPSTEGSIGYATYSNVPGSRLKDRAESAKFGSEELQNDWSRQPQDVQFYLAYFFENVTHQHYSLKQDSGNFLRTVFLDAALRNDALLYAVVGFSAFQRTLHHPGGKMQNFLQYYNKAVSLLLRSLMRKERRTVGTLLAVLQLATIEEHLGDWINLLGHQKAASEILTELYTPQNIMQTPLTRVVLEWYTRFDVFAGLLAGFQTVLSRDWFAASQEYYAEQVLKDPGNLHWKIEEASASIKLIGMEMSMLFAARGNGEIPHDGFLVENELIGRKLWNWRENMDPALKDSRWLVTDFHATGPADQYDIVNPYIPGILYHGALWPMNILYCDWHSIDLMHKYQTALALQSQPVKELAMGAYTICQLFEAIEYWPGSPKGSIVACQASLGIASLFLPRDETHNIWCRRKLAVVESNGYIYPPTFRTRMAALFQDPSCMQWWLPNNENYPTIIRSIRKFVEERTAAVRDHSTEEMRDMKAIFSSMKLEDARSSAQASHEVSPAASSGLPSDSDWSGHRILVENMSPQVDISPNHPQNYGYGFDNTSYFQGAEPNGETDGPRDQQRYR